MIVVDLVVGAIAGVAVAALVLALSRRPPRVHIPSHLPSPSAEASPPLASPGRSVSAPTQLMVVPPDKLRTFAAVGGMQAVKDDVRNTLGVGTDVLAQLLQSVESWRAEPRLVVVATTNELEALDSALLRAGRFDHQIRVDLPDAAARVAVLTAALVGRPVRAGLDLDAVARRTAGQTPASLVQAVELAALQALREAAGTGKVVQISTQHLLDALEERGGKDRPTVERWSWDRLPPAPPGSAGLRPPPPVDAGPPTAHRERAHPPAAPPCSALPRTADATSA